MKRICFFITFIFSFKALSIDFEDGVFPEFATSARALAMGNAFIGKVDDSSAAFYNPAGLGTVRHPYLHLSNFHLESNKGWLNTSTGGKVTDSFSNLTKGLSLEGTRELLVDNPGVLSHSRFHFLPNFTARYMSVGYLLSWRQRGYLGTEDDAEFEYAKRTDHGPYMSLNLSIWGGVFKLGVTALYLNRSEVNGSQDAETEIELEDSDFSKGSALIFTTGMKLTLPIAGLPTFAAVSHNTSQAKFGSARGAGAPDAIKHSIDLGFSLTPQIGKAIRIHLEANLKDSTSAFSDLSTSRKLTFGAEFDFARTVFVRLGYGDGFGSAGIGVRSRKVEFDLTTYAVDTTTSDFRGKEDRRFVLSFSSGF